MTQVVPVGGELNDSAADVVSGKVAAIRITRKRGAHVNLRDSGGAEIGTASNPLPVTPTGAAGPITVQQLGADIATAVYDSPVRRLLEELLVVLLTYHDSGLGVVDQGAPGTEPWRVDGSAAVQPVSFTGPVAVASLPPIAGQVSAVQTNATGQPATLALRDSDLAQAVYDPDLRRLVEQLVVAEPVVNQGLAGADPWPVMFPTPPAVIATPADNLFTSGSLNNVGDTVTLLLTGRWAVTLEIVTAFTGTVVFEGLTAGGTFQAMDMVVLTGGSTTPYGTVTQQSVNETLQLSAPCGAYAAVRARYAAKTSGTPGIVISAGRGPQAAALRRRVGVFKTVQVTATGNTAVWTPVANHKFRLMRFYLEMTENCTLSVAGVVTLAFRDGSTNAIGVTFDVWLPAAALTTTGNVWQSGWVDLGDGFLSALAGNVLNMNLTTALATGDLRVIAIGSEE